METKEVIILLLFAIILALLVYVVVMRARYKKDMQREQKRVREDADREIHVRTNALLRLCTIPFLWAMRAEIMLEHFAQIEQYFNQFVKEPGIVYIALIDLNESVRIATDKKTEGKPFREVFSENITGLNSLQVLDKSHDERIILAPVTGLNEKLGTIVIKYHPREV